MPVGADVGTCFLVSARKDVQSDESEVKINSIRDAFLEIEYEQSVVNMLKMSNVSHIIEGDRVYVIGEPALSVANLLRKEARRPLCKGVISAGEGDAEKMLMILLKNILGAPAVDDEVVYYSVPGDPIDSDMDIIYHREMFRKMIESFGFKAHPMNEAAAIVYSNGAADGFTALSSSCLTPGQRAITDKGFTKIEDIKKGTRILTKAGKWESCSPTSRNYKGKVYRIYAYGAADFELTSDHLVWVGRDGKWDWVKAKDVVEGDLIQQPWDNYTPNNGLAFKRPFLAVDERITSSKSVEKRNISLTDDMSELLGFWMGDGHLEIKRGAICFTQNSNETGNIERISQLVESIFNKNVSIYKHGENSCRVKFYSKSLLNWLKNNCYDKNGAKVIPWSVCDMNDSIIMSFLRGLIFTDGNVSSDKSEVVFTNTSDNLAQFVYLSLQRLGCNPTIGVSSPRLGKKVVSDGHMISGVKEVYSVRSSGYYSKSFIAWLENPYKTAKKSYIHGISVAKVTSTESREYSGKVYDVSVDGDDHSFCLPGAAIHNCGAGMVNTALVYKTMVGMAFAISRSGDWVDSSSAKAVGATATRMMSIKEKGVNLLDPTEGDPKQLREREAIVVYYRNLIHLVIDAIKSEFRKNSNTIELPDSIPWIISGGTAKAKNFLEFFKREFDKVKNDFPINISEIRMASDPLNDVAKGLLIAAMNE